MRGYVGEMKNRGGRQGEGRWGVRERGEEGGKRDGG